MTHDTNLMPGDTSLMPCDPDMDRVLAALRRQLDAYRRLAALSAVQSRKVAAGDTPGLLQVLEARDEASRRASGEDAVLHDFRRAWKDAVPDWPEAILQEVRQMLREARELLADVTGRDEADVLALQQRKAEVAGHLGRLDVGTRAGRRLNARYAAEAYGRNAGAVTVTC